MEKLRHQRTKDSTRTGCDARVQFSVSREGTWTAQKVILDHNYYLVSPNKSHKLRSQQHVVEADRMLIGQIRQAGMKPAQVYEFMRSFMEDPTKCHSQRWIAKMRLVVSARGT